MLAAIIQCGDLVVGQLSVARQMAVEKMDSRAEIDYDRTVWKTVAIWTKQAEDYVGAELGEAEAILFTTQLAMRRRLL
jgi:hypothetical protein